MPLRPGSALVLQGHILSVWFLDPDPVSTAHVLLERSFGTALVLIAHVLVLLRLGSALVSLGHVLSAWSLDPDPVLIAHVLLLRPLRSAPVSAA